MEEARLGLWHRDVIHMLDILSSSNYPDNEKLVALRLLREVLPNRQQEASILNAIPILTPYLYQENTGLLLNTLAVFIIYVITVPLAKSLIPDIPQLVKLLDSNNIVPIRRDSAHLLQIIADFVGPDPAFLSDEVPQNIVNAVSFRDNNTQFLLHSFGLLQRICNSPVIRDPLINSPSFMQALVRGLSNSTLRQESILLSSNLAMDPTHKAKIALVSNGVLNCLVPFLDSLDLDLRRSSLSLITLLSVCREGKYHISTDQDLPFLIEQIAESDNDELCRKAADEIKKQVCELPLGKAIMGKKMTFSRHNWDDNQ